VVEHTLVVHILGMKENPEVVLEVGIPGMDQNSEVAPLHGAAMQFLGRRSHREVVWDHS
jgi:hypothetical protein